MKRKIGHKLVIAIVLFSSLITLITTALQLYLDYRADVKRVQNYETLIEKSYLKSITASVWMYDEEQIRSQLSGILNLPDMERLEIVSTEGPAWADGSIISKRNIIQEFPLIYNYKGNDVSIGKLYAVISLDNIYARLFNRAIVILISNGFKTFLVSGFILLIFQYLVTRHLYALSSWLKNLQIGRSFGKFRLDRPSQKHGKTDELDEIVLATNEMQAKLKDFLSDLVESEERFKLAMEFANDGLFDWNLKTNQIYYSSGWKKMLGYEDHEIKNEFSEWERLTNPEDVKASWSILSEVLDGKRDRFQTEFKMRHKDGHWVDILSRANVIFDEKGEGNRVVGTHVDISERKRLERVLRESVEQQKLIIKTAMDGFWLIDNKGRLLEVNDTYCIMSGYNEDELLSKHISELDALESEEEVIKRIQRITSKGEDRFVSQHRRKDGTLVDVEISVQYRPKEGGRFVCFIRNITEKKQIETRLQQAQKIEAVGTLAGGIAHDFNNILGIILGNTELALDDLPEWNPARHNLDEVRKACLRAKEVIRQILTFSRKTESEQKPFNIAGVVTESLNLLRASIPSSIEIRQNIASDVFEILGDPTQIHQIMINLCTNAAHSMESEGGILEVALENKEIDEDTASLYPELEPGPHVHLRVSDTGNGISPEVMGRVFDPYFTTKDVGKGTGLGLSVVRGIVNNHNGRISVESKTGEGATFNILFPAVSGKTIEKPKDFQELPTGKERILFVDDEAPMVQLNQQRLERLGYQVTGKSDSTEALEFFRANPDQIDLIITDMTMPHMTGDRLAAEVFKIRSHIPIILCTGHSSNISKKRAKTIGVHQYLEKPIDKETLARSVRKALDEAKMRS